MNIDRYMYINIDRYKDKCIDRYKNTWKDEYKNILTKNCHFILSFNILLEYLQELHNFAFSAF